MEPSETISPFDTEPNQTQQDLISEDDLLQAVIKEINFSAEELDALIQQQADEFNKAEELISGVSYCLDPATGVLHIQKYPSLELIQSFPLIQNQQSFFDDSSTPQFAIQEWEPWATSICCVNPHHGAIEGFISIDQDKGYGLVVTSHNSFLFSHDPYNADILGQSLQCLYHRVHKSGQGQTCFDMHVSEDRQYLSIGDRHAGCLYLFDTQQNQLLGQVQIRKPGSLKAINVAFDYYEPRLFVTDNQSSKLTMIQLPDLLMEAIPLNFGEEDEDIGLGPVFGNLVKAPDIRYVYALSFKPNKAILASINIEMNEIESEITLKGQFFSQQQMDACDLMVLSPDQNLMLILTSYHEPYPFTPGVSVIDPHELKPLRFHVIPHALIEQLKPTMLVFAISNPVRNLQKTPLELLSSKGYITAFAIEEIKQKLIQGQLEGSDHETSHEIIVVDIDDPDGPSHGQGAVPALEPQAADQITLKPEQAIPAILFVLRKKLYQQTELDLESQPKELERFKELAESYRQQLESFDSVEVLIENINRKHTLETYLSRQDILSLMASQGFRNQEIVRPPMNCPSCHHKLKGNWDCPICFLELESPNRRLKKLRSSLDSLGAVSPYHLLMADPKRKRLLVLDDHKTIDWSLSLHELGIPSVLLHLCRHFWQALWLPNQNILVVDRKGHNVFETSPKGQITWALNQETNPDLSLKKPVKATYFTDPDRDWFLIVDQGNHRVLVVSRKQQLIFEYGVKGQPGYEDGFLSSPSDVQLTDEDSYLICDTGNHRVIEVQEQWFTPGQEPETVTDESEFSEQLEPDLVQPETEASTLGESPLLETPEEFSDQPLIESLSGHDFVQPEDQSGPSSETQETYSEAYSEAVYEQTVTYDEQTYAVSEAEAYPEAYDPALAYPADDQQPYEQAYEQSYDPAYEPMSEQAYADYSSDYPTEASEDDSSQTEMAYAMPTDDQDEQYPTLKLSMEEALAGSDVSESQDPETVPAESETLSSEPLDLVETLPEAFAEEVLEPLIHPEESPEQLEPRPIETLYDTALPDELVAEAESPLESEEPEPVIEEAEEFPPPEPYKKAVIIRQFGRQQGLNNPVFAQRLLNRDTLIVDAGNYRVIEVDPDGEIVSECFYFSADMPDDMRIDAPRQFIRREKKSVVLMDNDKVVEILPFKKKLIWSSMFKHLSRRVEILRDAFDKKDSYVQSFHQYRMPTLEELLNRLRAENRLGSSSGIAERLFESLKQLIEERRQRDAERDKQSQVKIYDEGHLQNIPIFLIDRSNQQILQINRQGQPIWFFGNTPQYKLMRPNHMTQTGSSLLLADTNHNRIIEVELADNKVIQVIGEDPKHNLAKPRSAYRTLAGHTLVTDQGHRRLVEFDENGQQVWEFNKAREISYPFFAMESGKDTILFVDLALHMVKEITREGQLIWAYGQSSRMGNEDNQLASPEYAVPLHTGAILIADTGNHRIIEVSPKRKILWEFVGNSKYTLVKPNWCQRLSNGNTLIAYQSYRCLLEVNREGEACWYFELGTEALGR